MSAKTDTPVIIRTNCDTEFMRADSDTEFIRTNCEYVQANTNSQTTNTDTNRFSHCQKRVERLTHKLANIDSKGSNKND